VKRLTDKAAIRSILNKNREWCLYALADLDDGMFKHCDWWAYQDGLALVFRALAIRPILTVGDAQTTREMLCRLDEPTGYLNLQRDHLDSAAGIYAYRERHDMRRMILSDFHPRTAVTGIFSIADSADIENLYATGSGGGIAFAPFQLETGFFRGVRIDGRLAAVAGVHVVSRNEGVAGVGNIFTHPDYRGGGLAQTVTSAVVSALLDAGIRTIGLNVEHTNTVAIRVYERLGFRTRFSYYEGIADRIKVSRPG